MFGWIQGFKNKKKSEMNESLLEKIVDCDISLSLSWNTMDDENRYKFNHPKRGLAVVINNEEFGNIKNLGDRHGSSQDAKSLFDMFQQLGFQVLHCKNLTAPKIVVLLKAVAMHYDHINSDCFACAVLSHGDETHIRRDNSTSLRKDIIYGVDGETVSTEVITKFFDDEQCQTLIGKPRLFFFQACRGDTLDGGVDINISSSSVIHTSVSMPEIITARTMTDSSSVDPPNYHIEHIDDTEAKKDPPNTASAVIDSMEDYIEKDTIVDPPPLYKDCLIMYATPPGHFAWRRGSGAWFIQSLCQVLESDAVKFGNIDLQKALVHVARKVTFDYESNMPDNKKFHRKKESPVLYSMLVKDIYFNNRSEESMNM
ncbi:Caspase-7 [Bulinus truncatus]|nr:Caspase-7 [Bulinus truncatus]